MSLSRPLGIVFEPAGYELTGIDPDLMDDSIGGRALRWSCLREVEPAAEERDT